MTTLTGDEQPPPDDTATRRLVMTTVNTPRGDVGRHAAEDTTGERGALTIADVVVEKVAATAAGEVEHVGGAHRRVLGVAASREDGGGRPRVSARVVGQVAALEVRLSVRYPASVRAVTETVRAQVRDRVHTLTGLTVTRVDISVASLAAASNTERRVLA